ncbi:MAG: ATP-binding cassette domain-containing protein [Bacilli bacterium]|nr:ATP-binding cassette domain-containing protein [Bacilli bacterium]
MLKLKKINKSYTTGDFTQNALKDVSLEFRQNEFVAILGPSGSGKTTLLNIIGGLDRYDSGDLVINNKSTKKFKATDWDAYRNNCIGFVFQNYNLISHINVLENVEMGMTLSGISSKVRRKKALEVLKKVGLLEHAHKKPNQLSGGQMQRVAIARALANDPDIILADEPTGALDSKTSVQIMELIKEIAKDKLVIMVTHNPELAKEYSTRIISMKDGKITEDSNPIEKSEKNEATYNIKKTAMSFLTALKLSLNNIRTKKGRTLLTAFASSIGIIGIALILSLSNGFDKQIDTFERNTLSSMPIIISEQSMNLDEETMMELQNEVSNTDDTYQDIDYVIPEEEIIETVIHKNNITEDFIKYLESADSEFVSGISYMRYTGLNLVNKIDNKITILDNSKLNISSIPKSLDEDKKTVIEERYDVLAGREAKAYNELVLIVDSKNHVSLNVIKALGLESKDKVAFKDIIGSEIKLVLNNDYYVNNGSYFSINTDLNKLYNNSESLEVVGIIRLKEDFPSYIAASGLAYTEDLLEYVIDENKDSDIVKKQQKSEYNVLTGEPYDFNNPESKMLYESTLAHLGKESSPYYIALYPRDFEAKEEVINYLDKFNEDKDIEDKIVYTDQAEIMSSLSSDIMDAITIVLVAFSGISLVVSSIMIGIIMYISVLERTKEIGILRSLGARKRDISRVFNAETFIIGVASGLLGILIARLLLFPVNALLLNLTNLENVAILNPIHALILITISVILTLIGGWLPAKMASKKDPVIALRTE